MTLDFIRTLAERAGRIAMQRKTALKDSDIEFKGATDLVTEVDKEVESFIVGEIAKAFPGHSTYGEEAGRKGSSDYCWIIDPIDGTTSYVHGQPFFSVSIGLHHKGVPLLAAVCAPQLGENFYAERGSGAFLNGARIHVSRRDKLINSVMATGFACIRARHKVNNLGRFTRILPKLRGIRRYGSAAIDLAYVACGRLEGFWELDLKPYDIAAGELLVTEAGGRVCDLKGGKCYPENGTVATNGLVDKELMPLLAED